MARTGQYKSYERGRRTYTLENVFTGGMKYSDAPLDEGQMRQLVNFDLSNDRRTLVPRRGLHFENAAFGNTGVLAYSEDKTPKLIKYSKTAHAEHAIVFDGASELHIRTDHSGKAYEGDVDVPVFIGNVQAVHNVPCAQTVFREPIGAEAYTNRYYMPSSNGFTVVNNPNDLSDSVTTDLEPRKLNAAEATMYGYNMLLDNPYAFVDKRISGNERFIFNGILPYDVDTGAIKFDPRVNEYIRFRAFYEAAPGKYYYIWRTRTADNDAYRIVKVGTVDIPTSGNLPELTYSVAVPHTTLFVELDIYNCTQVSDTPNSAIPGKSSVVYQKLDNQGGSAKWYYSLVDKKYIPVNQSEIIRDVPVLQRIEHSFNFSGSAEDSTRGMKFENYNLATCRGMSYWAGSLICYAPEKGRNILFLSAYNEPEFFPYPNNTDIFEEEIRYVTPYLSDLLVFTETQLWRLVKNTDKAGWTKSLIQGNLNISDYDIRFIQVVKNMVYFKSADNYFMVVPKTQRSTGELTLAPVSRTLDVFFADFDKGLRDLLSSTYGRYGEDLKMDFKEAEIRIRDAYCYLDYEDVHNVYMLSCAHQGVVHNITVELLYNTVVRYWRAYTYECATALVPYTADATRKTDLVSLVKDNSGAAVQIYKLYNIPRTAVKDDLSLSWGQAYPVVYPNYQLFDSGQHDYVLESKKRFRELQLFIHNLTEKNLTFNLEFLLDGVDRYPMFKYLENTQYDPNTGTVTVYLDKQPVLTETVPHVSGAFTINQETIPLVQLWKIRTSISGKGYAPRFLFASRNQEEFALVNFIWVYRLMYLR